MNIMEIILIITICILVVCLIIDNIRIRVKDDLIEAYKKDTEIKNNIMINYRKQINVLKRLSNGILNKSHS